MSAKLSLRMGADAGALERVNVAITEFAQAENWPSDLEFRLKIVLEELGLNIVNHGFNNSEGHEVEIELTSSVESVTIEIIDDGRPFDPLTEAPPPDLHSSVEERPVGGLGIHLVRTMMDEVRYRREADRNHLTLIKRRDG